MKGELRLFFYYAKNTMLSFCIEPITCSIIVGNREIYLEEVDN